jgi:hypothetical protein
VAALGQSAGLVVAGQSGPGGWRCGAGEYAGGPCMGRWGAPGPRLRRKRRHARTRWERGRRCPRVILERAWWEYSHRAAAAGTAIELGRPMVTRIQRVTTVDRLTLAIPTGPTRTRGGGHFGWIRARVCGRPKFGLPFDHPPSAARLACGHAQLVGDVVPGPVRRFSGRLQASVRDRRCR